MKKLIILLLLTMALPCLSRAQTPEVTQLILNLEKLRELRKILQELKKGYEILFEGYSKIRDSSRGNFKLHEAFLDALLQVSPAVKNYGRIKDIVQTQLAILNECRSASSQLTSSGQFTAREVAYLQQVYSDVLTKSIKNLDALADVVTAKKLRASDDERLAKIDAIYRDISEQLVFVRQLTSNNSMLAAQRKDENASLNTIQQILGIKP